MKTDGHRQAIYKVLGWQWVIWNKLDNQLKIPVADGRCQITG